MNSFNEVFEYNPTVTENFISFCYIGQIPDPKCSSGCRKLVFGGHGDCIP